MVASITRGLDNTLVFALDQSTRLVGYSIWEHGDLVQFGSYEPKYEMTTDERLYDIFKWLDNAVSTILKKKPNKEIKVLMEDVYLQVSLGSGKKTFSNRDNNVLSFKVLSQLQGAIILFCQMRELEYEIIHHSDWKNTIGIKSTTKRNQKIEAMELIEEAFGEYADENEVDAICIGYAYTIEKNSSEN